MKVAMELSIGNNAKPSLIKIGKKITKKLNYKKDKTNLNMSVEIDSECRITTHKFKKRIITTEQTCLNNREWLTDSHIERFTQLILKDQPKKINTFDPAVINHETFHANITDRTAFIYNVGLHWVLISNFYPNKQYDPTVWYIFDSVRKERKKAYKKLFKKLLPNQDTIILHLIYVQQQIGINDCGLFSLTNLMALVNDEDPSLKNYEQDKMREHFNTCNDKTRVTPFPQSTTQLKPRTPSIISLSLK
jgi:Ulp1 family protease